MADMHCLDTSCFGEMNRGNKAVAEGIEDLIRSGEIVAVPSAVHKELKNTSDPVTRAADLRLIEDLKIKVLDDPGPEARARMYDIYAQHEPGTKNTQGNDISGQPKKGGPGASATNKDVVVVAEVMHYSRNKPAGVNNVRLWTMERLKGNPAQLQKEYGVSLSPKCSITGVPNGTPRVGYAAVRGYFSNLRPIQIAADGTIIALPTPPPPGGGGGGGNTTITPNGPGPQWKGSPGDVASRQERLGGGIVLGLQLIDFGLNVLNDMVLREDIQKAMNGIRPAIEAEMTKNPSQGTLVVIYCRRPIAHPDSVIRPGDRFDHLEYGFGLNADDARAKMNATPAIRPGADEKVERMVTAERWYDAIAPVGVEQLPTPYPKFALAVFSFGKAKLQDVEWNGTFGFDDEGETTLKTGGDIPLFVILKPPTEIKWIASAWAVDRHSPPLLDIDAAKGGKLPVVNLDPNMPFSNVSAAMVFPANDLTAAIFQQGPATKGPTGQLGRQNISKLRWIRPQNLEILRKF